jgi:hypothetical protein
MSARLVREAFLTLALGGSKLDAAGVAGTAAFAGPLRDSLSAFARAAGLDGAADEGPEGMRQAPGETSTSEVLREAAQEALSDHGSSQHQPFAGPGGEQQR